VKSICDLSQPLLGGIDRYLGNIQDCDIVKTRLPRISTSKSQNSAAP
jgi:hypothetical protein